MNRVSSPGPQQILMTQTTNNALAIFDIGSNAVRLTVYNRETGAIMHKAVELCEMGRLDPVTHALYPPGATLALKTLDRFCQMVRNPTFHVTGVVAVATEAVRRATDGAAFIQKIKTDLGLDITILSEQDEGVYGARGVLAHTPNTDGVVADLGGGSLQLTRVVGGDATTTHSMPLGTLRLLERPDNANTWVDHELASLPETLVPAHHVVVIGGSWRSLAKLYLARAGVQRTDVDGLDLELDKTRALVAWLNDVPRSEMMAILTDDYHLEPRRAEVLPVAGNMLLRLLDRLTVDRLTVSSAGIRDGIFQAVQSVTLVPGPVPHPPSKHNRGG